MQPLYTEIHLLNIIAANDNKFILAIVNYQFMVQLVAGSI